MNWFADPKERIEAAMKNLARTIAECEVARQMAEWHSDQYQAIDPYVGSAEAFDFANHIRKREQYDEDHRLWSLRRADAEKKIETLKGAFK
jgi:hypothetical protein